MEENIREKMKRVVDKDDQVVVLSTYKKGFYINWDTKDIEHLKSMLMKGLAYIKLHENGKH